MIIAKKLDFQLPRIHSQYSWDREHRGCRSPTFIASFVRPASSVELSQMLLPPFILAFVCFCSIRDMDHDVVRNLALLLFGSFMNE